MVVVYGNDKVWKCGNPFLRYSVNNSVFSEIRVCCNSKHQIPVLTSTLNIAGQRFGTRYSTISACRNNRT